MSFTIEMAHQNAQEHADEYAGGQVNLHSFCSKIAEIVEFKVIQPHQRRSVSYLCASGN
jgi:hypothetical protein